MDREYNDDNCGCSYVMRTCECGKNQKKFFGNPMKVKGAPKDICRQFYSRSMFRSMCGRNRKNGTKLNVAPEHVPCLQNISFINKISVLLFSIAVFASSFHSCFVRFISCSISSTYCFLFYHAIRAINFFDSFYDDFFLSLRFMSVLCSHCFCSFYIVHSRFLLLQSSHVFFL